MSNTKSGAARMKEALASGECTYTSVRHLMQQLNKLVSEGYGAYPVTVVLSVDENSAEFTHSNTDVEYEAEYVYSSGGPNDDVVLVFKRNESKED